MPDYQFKPANHIKNFSHLAESIINYLTGNLPESDTTALLLNDSIRKSCAENGFFTESSVRNALRNIAEMLNKNDLSDWLNSYSIYESKKKQQKTIGVVMAGNIPLVGFHDFLCVLMSGHKILGKLSKNDSYLLPALAQMLIGIDGHYSNLINFTFDKIQGFDAVIATGSNNTARYFEYYFKKYPHIIRKNRNSIAVLGGNETPEELASLTEDMFLYFGLGCRNVSKIFVPAGYNFFLLTEASKKFADYVNHNNFRNNYDYYKTIFLMNNQAFIDGGFYILKENQLLHNPVSVFHYEYYSDIVTVKDFISENTENLQCIVANIAEIPETTQFGKTQKPNLWDYADNIDTIEFLLKL